MKEAFSLADLRDWSVASDGEDVPLRLAVFGDPVAHSASPPMHNAALEQCGIAARYGRLHIRPEALGAALRLLPEQGFIGVNCTIPHKAAALPLMDRVDEHARRIGVVNTVAVEGDRLAGFNTDGPGLVRALRAEFGVVLRDLRVLVLGAGGGAGRAIAMQCGLEGCARLVLVNRTPEKARALALELERYFVGGPKDRLLVAPWEDAALRAQLGATDLVIHCTSVGMKPTDPSPLPGSPPAAPDDLRHDLHREPHPADARRRRSRRAQRQRALDAAPPGRAVVRDLVPPRGSARRDARGLARRGKMRDDG